MADESAQDPGAPLPIPTPGPGGAARPARFGDVAVEMGYLTQEQVAQLVEKQKRFRDLGFPKRMDEIAVEEAFIASVDCDRVLKRLQELRQVTNPIDEAAGEVAVPSAFGEYEIEQRLDGTPHGTMYRATSRQTGGDLDVKIIPDALAEDKAWWDHLKFNARVASTLTHPNMVEVKAAGQVKKRPFFALVHVDGISLEKLLSERGVLPEKETLRIIRGVAYALYHAHVVDLAYLGVQPSLVVIDTNDRPRLYGLGMPKRYEADPALKASGLVATDPHYLSPEQCRNEDELGPASDLYSLGALMYRMLCGRPPFEGSDDEIIHKHLNERPVDPGQFAPKLSKYATAMVLKLLEKKPEDRYEGADHVAGAIEKMLEAPKLMTGLTRIIHKGAPDAAQKTPSPSPEVLAKAKIVDIEVEEDVVEEAEVESDEAPYVPPPAGGDAQIVDDDDSLLDEPQDSSELEPLDLDELDLDEN